MSQYYSFYPVKKIDGKYIYTGYSSENEKMIPIFQKSQSFVPYNLRYMGFVPKDEELSEQLIDICTYEDIFYKDKHAMLSHKLIRISEIERCIRKGILTTAYIENEVFKNLKLLNENDDDLCISENILENYYDNIITQEEYINLSAVKKKEYVKYTWIDDSSEEIFWYQVYLIWSNYFYITEYRDLDENDYLFMVKD